MIYFKRACENGGIVRILEKVEVDNMRIVLFGENNQFFQGTFSLFCNFSAKSLRSVPKLVIRSIAEIYKDFLVDDELYVCSNYPDCKSYVAI